MLQPDGLTQIQHDGDLQGFALSSICDLSPQVYPRPDQLHVNVHSSIIVISNSCSRLLLFLDGV